MRALAALFVLAVPVCAFPAGVYLWANGATLAGTALASVTALAVLAAVGAAVPRARRGVAWSLALVVAADGAWVVARLAGRSAPPPGMQVCVNSDCGPRGSFWQLVPPEHEAARAGLYLAKLVGAMRGAEFDHFDRLLDTEYGRLTPAWRSLPNSLLMFSSPSRVEYLRWVPPGREHLRCLVFLHGFGGELTPYLRAMVESPLGETSAALAPALDSVGWWPSERGLGVVRALTDRYLPPQCDRDRVYLVGLSNGSIGAARIFSERAPRSAFRGAILVSGGGDFETEAPSETRWLFLTGAKDPRFGAEELRRIADGLARDGAAVMFQSIAGADHFLLLTHQAEWTRAARDWLDANEPPGRGARGSEADAP